MDRKQDQDFVKKVREVLDADDERMYAKVTEKYSRSKKRELIIGRILLVSLPTVFLAWFGFAIHRSGFYIASLCGVSGMLGIVLCWIAGREMRSDRRSGFFGLTPIRYFLFYAGTLLLAIGFLGPFAID